MFKKLRIAFLLYILLMVAAGQWLTRAGATDWDEPLWVELWLIDADGDPDTRAFIHGLDATAFDAIERFFSEQAATYGVAQARPFRIELAGELDRPMPAPPPAPGWFGVARWSLAMRWFTFRLGLGSNRPTPDIRVFARYHTATAQPVLDNSVALRKNMLAIANVFAARNMRGSNQVVIAHELLHTLGATDKYNPATNLPLLPLGVAEPHRKPLLPQRTAELMAGRIPIDPATAEIPASLQQVTIGPITAWEIGWLDTRPALD